MKNVLIIEDDHIILKAIRNILSRGGYNSLMAKDGKEAFELLDNADYDVIITDLMMPHANGLEIVSRVRKNHTKKHVGIIVVSSMGHEDMVTEAFSLGADDYLKKPIMAGELLSRLKKLTMKETLLGKSSDGAIDTAAPVTINIPKPESRITTPKQSAETVNIQTGNNAAEQKELRDYEEDKPIAATALAPVTAADKQVPAAVAQEAETIAPAVTQTSEKPIVAETPAVIEPLTETVQAVVAEPKPAEDHISVPIQNIIADETNEPAEINNTDQTTTEVMVNDADVAAEKNKSKNDQPHEIINTVAANPSAPVAGEAASKSNPDSRDILKQDAPVTNKLTEEKTATSDAPQQLWKPDAIAEVTAILQETMKQKTTSEPVRSKKNAVPLAEQEETNNPNLNKGTFTTVNSAGPIKHIEKQPRIADGTAENRAYKNYYVNIILIAIVLLFIVFGILI